MYQAYWGLRESPFRACADRNLFFQSPLHDEALARLHFLVDQQRRLGLVMGEPGGGKSLLLEVFREELYRSGCAIASVSLLGLTPSETLYEAAFGLELNLNPDDSLAVLWRRFTDRLTEYRLQQTSAVLLFDDADAAASPVLDLIGRLVQFDRSPEARFTVVLAGNREQMGKLGLRLLDLAELRVDLEPWSARDTADYLDFSLTQARLTEASRKLPVFDQAAVTSLHELTHGIPRQVSQLADLALLAGAGAELEQIDAGLVESVYHELGVVHV